MTKADVFPSGVTSFNDRPFLSIEISRECPLRCPRCYAYGSVVAPHRMRFLESTSRFSPLESGLRFSVLVWSEAANKAKRHPEWSCVSISAGWCVDHSARPSRCWALPWLRRRQRRPQPAVSDRRPRSAQLALSSFSRRSGVTIRFKCS